MNKVKSRTLYYKEILIGLLEMLRVDISKIKFVVGSEYQLNSDYMLDVLKMGNITSISAAKHAGTEVVKQTDNPALTSLLYPLMQALDEQYLQCDIELGGVDQRKIFAYSRENMPKLGYKKRIFLMNQMIPALSTNAPPTIAKQQENTIVPTDHGAVFIVGTHDKATQHPPIEEQSIINKMSASEVNSKIDILDTPNAIKKKVGSCYCLEGEIKDNTLLLICEKVIFPILQIHEKQFIADRPEKYGGPITYENTEFDKLISDFGSNGLHPMDLKTGISTALISFFEPIRAKFSMPEMVKLTKDAYN
jgi:tyrosyl-tRNA synthetase